MEKTTRKRKAISIKKKIKLIEESKKPGFRQSHTAKEHGIPQSTLANILRNEDFILAAASQGPSTAKRQSHGKEDVLEHELYDWFLKKRVQSVPIDDPLLRKQAQCMVKEKGINTTLKFSEGWLAGWKKRFNVNFRKQHGEKQSADTEAAKTWIQNDLPALLEQYSPKDLFNADETGLFYRGLPNRTFVAKGEKPSGTKVAKERLTVLVCTNQDGSEKKKLLIIGKAARPRGFPRDPSTLPVQWESSKKAWMNGKIWAKFLTKWGMEMRLQSRHILLLVDNAPSHPEVPLTNVKVVYLPKNTTALIQPCDAGIIRSLKGFYHTELRDRVLATLEAQGKGNSADAVKKVSVLDAVHMVARAWQSVSSSTVVNCFKKAFSLLEEEAMEDDYDDNRQDVSEGSVDFCLPAGMALNDYDAFLAAEDDAIQRAKLDSTEGAENENEETEEVIDVIDIVKPKEGLAIAAQLRTYAQSRGLSPSILLALKQVESECLTHMTEIQKQPRMTDFSR